MLDPLDPLFFFACFDDDEDVTCPYCQASFVVASEEGKSGEEQFQCEECSGQFVVDWEQGKIHYNA